MPEPAPLLGPAQRKVVGFALSLLAFLATVVLLATILFGLARTLGYFSAVLWPLAVAGILALILRPIVEMLERRLRIRRLPAVVILFGAFVLSVLGILISITPLLVSQTVDFAHALPKLWDDVSAYFQAHYPAWIAFGREKMQNPAIKQFVDGLATDARQLLMELLPGVRAAFGQIRSAIGFVVGLAVMPVYLFFFLLSDVNVPERLHGGLTFLRNPLRDDIVFLVREFVGIVVAFFRGQLLIGLIMGVAYAVGFSAVGLKFGLVIGLAMGLLNIVPYLGTIFGLSIAVPLAFLQPDGGGVGMFGLVAAVFCAVQAFEGWFLTPRIMGRQTGLHPVAIIFSVLFWGTALGGIFGMMLAVPLSAFFVTVWRLLKHKYLGAAEEPA